MNQVIVNQWFEQEGGYGRVPRYSLHPDEQTCQSFAEANESDRLRPEGKVFEAEVDEQIYERVQSSGQGMWYAGRVRADGEEIDLGERKA